MDEELLIARLSTAAIVGYTRLPDEPDFSLFLAEHGVKAPEAVVPLDKEADPFAAAESLAERFFGRDVAVLVPGRAFDALGTRHGRGGGWYDRFLSRIPREWTRIGVVSSEHLSSTPLVRKPWDEPVDWLLVRNAGWSIMRTGARPGPEPTHR